MLNESLMVGALLLVLFGAACFYLYTRLAYAEKRIGFMETILMDIKLAMEAEEEMAAAAAAGARGSGPAAPAPEFAAPAHLAPFEPKEVEDVAGGEQEYYKSVLSSVEERAVETANADGAQGTNLDELEATAGSRFPGEEEAPVVAAAAPVVRPAVAGPNYDNMSKKELEALAEKRGIRVTKRQGRAEIISLLRRSEPVASVSENQEEASEGHVEGNAASSLFPNAASLDGDFPVDLGQGDAQAAEQSGELEEVAE